MTATTDTMNATASIKMPRVYINRTLASLEETREMMSKMNNPELVATYKTHTAALYALLDVAEPVDNYTGAEAIEMASSANEFIKQFKREFKAA